FTASMIWFIRVERNNSDGFGGNGPLVIMYKLFTDVSWTTSCKGTLSVINVDKPLKFLTLNILCNVGFRKSLSIIKTFLFSCANVAAKFADKIDLPDPGPADVTLMVFSSESTIENCKLVR